MWKGETEGIACSRHFFQCLMDSLDAGSGLTGVQTLCMTIKCLF